METQNRINLSYIPDPTKKHIALGYATLEQTVLRTLQKPVQPLMTAVAVSDVDAYLSQKHKKESTLKWERDALPRYEYDGGMYYRRTDLDALVFHEKAEKPEPISGGRKDPVKKSQPSHAKEERREEGDTTLKLDGRLYYTTQEWKTIDALEEALKRSHVQAAQIKMLSGKALPNDFARIVCGDATSDFLIRDECYAVAAAYAEAVYKKAKEGAVWPISDNYIQKRDISDNQARREYCQAYELYRRNPSEETLIALFKSIPRLSRGYIAAVGWYFAEKDVHDEKRKGNWNGKRWKYAPAWKDAWEFFASSDPRKKGKRGETAISLSEPVFGASLHEERTEKLLRSRYEQLWYHAKNARENLVIKYEAFAVSQARKSRFPLPLEDRISLAKEGLLRATQKYDPTSNNNFATYAKHWIKAMISREWRESTDIRITPNMWEKIFKIQKAMRELEPGMSKEERDKTLMEKTGFPQETIETACGAWANNKKFVSLDDKAHNNSNGRNETFIHDIIADDSVPQGDEEVERVEQHEILKHAQKCLTKREQYVLEERFNGGDWEGKRLSEIGEEMGLSRERVRQIERGALQKLRAKLKEMESIDQRIESNGQKKE